MPVTNSKTTLTNTTHTGDGTYYTTGTGTVFEPYTINQRIVSPWADNTICIGTVEAPLGEWEKALARILDLESEEKVKARPKDPIDRVFFNYKKRTTTIIWKDKTVTTVKCAEDEEFDEEKGIAICFMKKFFDNRGCFNEFLKKYLEESIIQ